MLNKEIIEEMGLPLENAEDPVVWLRVESCLEWLKENTTLEFEADDIESLKSLPGSVKLFICRYNDLYSRNIGVTSESIGGMSQSFDTTAQYNLLWQLAYELLGKYLKSGIKAIPARKKWC